MLSIPPAFQAQLEEHLAKSPLISGRLWKEKGIQVSSQRF